MMGPKAIKSSRLIGFISIRVDHGYKDEAWKTEFSKREE
jgi:hypothetical protein